MVFLELKAAIGEILINDKNQVIVLEQNKILLPPSSYLSWGFHDRSIRYGTVGSDKVKFNLLKNLTFIIF